MFQITVLKENKALHFQPKAHRLLDVANYNLLIFLMFLHCCFPLMRDRMICLWNRKIRICISYAFLQIPTLTAKALYFLWNSTTLDFLENNNYSVIFKTEPINPFRLISSIQNCAGWFLNIFGRLICRKKFKWQTCVKNPPCCMGKDKNKKE